MKIRYIILSIIVASGYFIVSSCGVEYKLTNAKLDYSIYKTIAVGDFPNQAPWCIHLFIRSLTKS